MVPSRINERGSGCQVATLISPLHRLRVARRHLARKQPQAGDHVIGERPSTLLKQLNEPENLVESIWAAKECVACLRGEH